MILKIIGIIVIIFIIFMIMPYNVTVKYRDDVEVVIKMGPFKKKILPKAKKKKKKKKPPEEKKKEKKEVPEKPKAKIKLETYKELYTELKDNIYGILNYIIKRGIKIVNFELGIEYGWEDEPSVYMTYGLMNAFIYTAMGVICDTITVRNFKVDIVPQCKKDEFKLSVLCTLHTRGFRLSVIGIKAGVMLIKALKIIKASKKAGGEGNGESDRGNDAIGNAEHQNNG